MTDTQLCQVGVVPFWGMTVDDGRPTAVLIANIKRLRRKRGLTAQQLSERLTELGVNIGRVGVAKMEGGNRRSISIDELFALALALNVSPMTLLVPEAEDEHVEVTPTTTATSREIGLWIAGEKPLAKAGGPAWMDWVRELPPWKMRAVANTLERMSNAISDADDTTVEQMKGAATPAGRELIELIKETGTTDAQE